MTIARRISFLALLAASANVAAAQRSGTFELGVFGHYTKLDNDVRLGTSSLGVGGRIGFFPLRHLSLEGEYSYGTIKDNVRDVSAWYPFRGFVMLHLPVASKVKLLLGAGYKYDTWKGDTTKNQYEDAFTMIGGLRFCTGGSWSIRPSVVFDWNPSPNNQVPVTETSRHVSMRLGVSRFVGRGQGTCAGLSAPDTPPPPRTVPPPVTAPPPVVAAPPPAVSISASPTSITAGQTSMLTWSSTNATTCSAPWTTSGGSSGSQQVSPTSTTTYTLTCTGAGGSANANATVTVAAAAPPPVTPPAAPPREVFRFEGVYFDFDKSTIKPEGRVKLDEAVAILNRLSDLRVEIQGHTDWIGTDEYNVKLGERRAKAVHDYLISKGIAASRLTSRSFGETQPVADNATAEGRAQNRRVMLIEIR